MRASGYRNYGNQRIRFFYQWEAPAYAYSDLSTPARVALLRMPSAGIKWLPVNEPGASPMSARLKRDWLLHEAAFRRFLDWLDEGVDSRGEKYVEIRRRLVSYFARKNCLTPDELADEALTRVARRLEEEGAITDAPPARY